MNSIVYLFMQTPSEVKLRRDTQLSVREALGSKKEELQTDADVISESLDDSDGDEGSFDARMRQQILSKRKELGDLPTRKLHKGQLINYTWILEEYIALLLN